MGLWQVSVQVDLRGVDMIPDDIRHLDRDDVSPFDALVAIDSAIQVARVAQSSLLGRLLYDAVRDDQEPLMAEAMSHLWSARQNVRDCAEEIG
jgi:hypothetical protein